jgi:hypothetical protein
VFCRIPGFLWAFQGLRYDVSSPKTMVDRATSDAYGYTLGKSFAVGFALGSEQLPPARVAFRSYGVTNESWKRRRSQPFPVCERISSKPSGYSRSRIARQ